jgi:predicted O-methyltransferase YrrM
LVKIVTTLNQKPLQTHRLSIIFAQFTMFSQSTISVPPHPDVMKNIPRHVTELLDQLHNESLEQESKLSRDNFKDDVIQDTMRDKFIALDQDKCQFLYTLCRATGARTIVEAGTSFGVSTIYLALAAAANAAAGTGGGGNVAKVIATEHEPSKAARAREHWRKCGESVYNTIDLREGDLRETLKENVERVDLLLLDSKSASAEAVFLSTPFLLSSLTPNSLDSHGSSYASDN